MKIEEEEEEVDIAEEQLRHWVCTEVEKDERVARRRAQLAQVEEWVKQKEREATYTRLLYSNACESVLECESVMKGLYGMLGLEYRDTDSEEDEGAKSTEIVIQIEDEDHDVEVESDEDDDYVVIDLGATVPESLEDESKEQSTRIQSSVEVLDSKVKKPETVPTTTMNLTTTSTPYKNIAEFFRQFTDASQMNREPSPSRTPELSIDSLETIKTRDSPVNISCMSSTSDLPALTLQIRSSPSHPTNPSTNEIMDTPPLITACAVINGTEHLETSASEASACRKQDIDASAQTVASTIPSTPAATSAFTPGSSEKILINATLTSGIKSSSAHVGKTTVIEQAKSNPKLGNNFSTSVSCSTPTPSKTSKKATPSEKSKGKLNKTASSIPASKTKETTSITTASPQHAEADAKSLPKASQSVASTLTSSISPHSTGVSKASSVTCCVSTHIQQKVELKVNMSILGKRRTKTWHLGTIVEIRTTETGQRYKVQFEQGKGKSVLSGHHLAYVGSPMLKDLFVGCRVVACYKEEHQSWLHAAVVTEMPDRKNRMRFLVFFDDGRPAYVALPDLHLVCTPLKNVCEDIEDKACRMQVEEYLQAYPNPIFVVVQLGQESKAECEGKLESCTITQVDCSLIQVCYKKNEEKEWLYKGSNRLEHIQRIKKKMAEKKKEQSSNQGRFIQRNNLPTTTAATSIQPSTTVVLKPSASQSVPHAVATVTSSSLIAKAAIPISQPTVTLHRINLSTSTIPVVSVSKASQPTEPAATCSPKTGTKRPATEEDLQTSQALAFEARLKYVPHRCCPACLNHTRPMRKDEHRGKNPLLIPLLYGFRRMTARKRLEGKVSFDVFYRSSCGRSMSNMEEVQDFLFESRCDFLFLDMFCLDPFVLVRRALLPSSMTCRPHLMLPDISEGKEVIPVPCVNEVDSTPLPLVTYTRHRTPGPGVFINTSLDFMMGCDCMDGCRDRSTCSCHQLTIEATSLFTGGPVDANAGYLHKRLTRDLPSGVYECNPLCRCDPWMCCNRLVQHGLQLRLEVFMTQHKGWGIRCLDDLAKGTFVCIFTGKIVTDEMVSMDNALSGNEFLANLDFIEGVEKLKEGYESEAYCSDKEGESDKKTLLTMTTGALKKHAKFRRDSDSSSGEEKEKTNQQKKKKGTAFEDMLLETNQSIPKSPKPIPKFSGDQTEVTSFMAKQMRKKGHSAMGFARKSTRPFAIKSIHRKVPTQQGKRSTCVKNTRSLFSGEKACYLINAKQEGNIARYINHSCSPNLFVQNVFVDTHDLRFPWVAFFTSKRIKAGTELTWDYSYEVGSVEGKVLLCCCGSDECTGRLL
ncbi:histone-lysine N-methyltransferase SETDB1-A isoform X2 [Electrophorus electricus]|nr:histone-lysine N-methyltransferase SETDB1-A isoform X2 [Electrophorus electricus]XP_026858103.2 histone-lysine N-methyltransferase SETDB1-A isoform X2 [Electrophorus electricus]